MPPAQTFVVEALVPAQEYGEVMTEPPVPPTVVAPVPLPVPEPEPPVAEPPAVDEQAPTGDELPPVEPVQPQADPPEAVEEPVAPEGRPSSRP